MRTRARGDSYDEMFGDVSEHGEREIDAQVYQQDGEETTREPKQQPDHQTWECTANDEKRDTVSGSYRHR
jgi:hypothetical protein